MAAVTRTRAHEDERAYRAHERAVTGMLAARYRDLDSDSRYELYHEAWASVLKRRGDGVQIDNLEGYLMGAADKLASKRVYGADSRRRVTFDPVDGRYAAVPDTGQSPEEAVLAADEARRVRMLIDELDGAERALLKLRLDLGLDPSEIRERLGLTDRQYRRVAERAGRALLDQFRALDSGAWAKRKRSLLCACVFGVASERQRAKARDLIQHDPCCRAMMSELRELGGRAAAVLPLPAGPIALDAAGVDHAGRAAELLAGVKQHAAGAYARMSDPTPLAGARPGALATVVAGCIAAGGGAYCAVEGVPGSIKPALHIERPAEQAEEQPVPNPVPPNAHALPAPPQVVRPPSSPAQTPAAAPQTQAAPPAPEREFEPPAPPAPAPVAPATAGESEFGGP
jgi:DNA-directed RNA polymerase specialized sigma24 family protein